jgi:uncharacterized delta-60 repeat protein
MPRSLLAALALLLSLPAAAHARPADPDRSFGQRGTVTLRANAADAVGGAVRVISGNRVLAGGSAGGQLVVVKLRRTGSLDSSFGTGGQVVPALPGTSPQGVRAIATFRDGRIIAAGTLTQPSGTRFVVLRLLPGGEIDPSFGAGRGYVLFGSPGSQLADMAMDQTGNIILAGARPAANGGEAPVMIRLLADGTPDTTFGVGGVVDRPYALGGRVTSLLVRPEGTVTFSVAAGPTQSGLASFTVGRLLANGTADVSFGAGTGVVTVPLGPGSGLGLGAAVVRRGPGTRTLVAGTDVSASGTPRGTVVRLRADGSLDTRFGERGIARVARAGIPIRFTSMVRDSQQRILLAGTGRLPGSLVVRLRPGGARDRSFGNGGLTYPRLGRPPGGTPIYTTVDALDAAGSRAVLAGSAAGPGPLVRGATGTLYTGRFALTVSRLQ